MSSFTNALILKKKEKREWEVIQDFTYEVGELGSGEAITVPCGFKTDLASIPRIFWSLLPPDGDYSQACVLHDWMCVQKGQVEKYYNYKKTSDIFLEAMEVLKVTKITRQILYRGVLWFGPRF
jgi:hypothetical protein